ARDAWPTVPVGVNLGKNADTPLDAAEDDYRAVARAVTPYADYLAVNVSSPNTVGLRGLQEPERLRALLEAVIMDASGLPVLVKLAPDLSDASLRSAAAVAQRAGVAGIVATNTTLGRAGLRHDPGAPGGLSGRPLALRSREVLAVLRPETDLPIVSVGGIDGPEEAVARLRAGADLLQLYTGLIYEGPGLIARIHDGIVAEMARVGATGLDDLRRSHDPRSSDVLAGRT
ncbi:MAG: dihydroorotate dehydrogenase (quinone), partial [Trueperaceae bacterium]